MLNVEAVFQDMIAFDPDRRRTNHLLKVQAYAEMIGRCEGMDEEDLFWLRIAALLHDIGIKPSLEKYESTAGPYQQREGSPLARDLLTRRSAPVDRVERIAYLVAHHHEYANIDGLDYQILVEADFLVNCDEGKMDLGGLLSVRDTIFKTGTGIALLNQLFELDI